MTEVKITQIASEVFDYVCKNAIDNEVKKFEIKTSNNEYNVICMCFMEYKKEKSTGTFLFVKGYIDIICIEDHNDNLISFMTVAQIEDKIKKMISELVTM